MSNCANVVKGMPLYGALGTPPSHLGRVLGEACGLHARLILLSMVVKGSILKLILFLAAAIV